MLDGSTPNLRLVSAAGVSPDFDAQLVHKTLAGVIGTFPDYSMLCEKGQPPVRLFLTSRAKSVSMLRNIPMLAEDLATLENLAVEDRRRLQYKWDGQELIGELSAH